VCVCVPTWYAVSGRCWRIGVVWNDSGWCCWCVVFGLAGWLAASTASKQAASQQAQLLVREPHARLAFARPGKWCKVQVPVPVTQIAEMDGCLRYDPIFTFTCKAAMVVCHMTINYMYTRHCNARFYTHELYAYIPHRMCR
jgi:hypothetical protein